MTTNQAPEDFRQATVPLWTDKRICASIHALSDIVVNGDILIDEDDAIEVAIEMRDEYEAKIGSLQAAYDLRGVHLDAAHHHIATLENAIVVGGGTLRAIRDEIEGGNDE